jgi:chromosome segregation ATPase
MSHTDGAAGNGHDEHVPAAPAKGKTKQGKKPVDSGEASKLVAARISQLEQEHAGEKDQEAEIEREVKRATRELNQQIAKLEPLERKIDFLLKRCSEHLAELRRAQRDNKTNKTRADNLQKDKDANRTELSKNVGLKEKLEKLCRELQKDNNKLKSDLKTLQNSDKDRIASYDQKYNALLSKLSGLQSMKDLPPPDPKTDVDELFRQRFKIFIEQYEIRELHYHSYMRTKELEVQYFFSLAEDEKRKAEEEATKARSLQAQVQTFHKTETDLRQQLNVYIDKFKQVEDTLNNSNELFLSFRKEMEDMSKKTKKLEKENEVLRRKHDATSARILDMVEEREDWKKAAEHAEQKAAKLTSIIQQMQSQGRRAPISAPRKPQPSSPSAGNGGGVGGGGNASSAAAMTVAPAGTSSNLGHHHSHPHHTADCPGGQSCDDALDEFLHDEVLMEVLAADPRSEVASEPVPYGPERPPPPPPKAVPVMNGRRV